MAVVSSDMVIARMERLPLARFHYKMLTINGAAWAFDAFDTGLVTFVVTALTAAWGLTPGQIGAILSIGLLGMFVGAIVSGPTADRWGRKAVFQVTMLFYSVFSLLCAFSPNLTTLLICRFLVGVGLGGETPVVTSLLGEFVPARNRGKVQGLLNTFWAAGWLVAAVISYFIIPAAGWQWAFVAGAVPAFYIFIVRRHLPESPRWLISKGRVKEAEDIVSQIENEISKTTELPPVNVEEIANLSKSTTKVTIATLFSSKYIKRTIMLWGLWFLGMFGYYGLFSWLPSLFVQAGHTMVKSFLYVLIMQIAYIPNQVFAAYLMDKVGRKKLLVINLFLAGIATVLYGWALGNNIPTVQVILLGIITSLFVSAIWGITYTYTPEQYPTSVRATGTGAASACSRVGSMLAPIVIGASLTSLGIGGVFAIVAGAFVLASLLVGILGMETKGMVLHD